MSEKRFEVKIDAPAEKELTSNSILKAMEFMTPDEKLEKEINRLVHEEDYEKALGMVYDNVPEEFRQNLNHLLRPDLATQLERISRIKEEQGGDSLSRSISSDAESLMGHIAEQSTESQGDGEPSIEASFTREVNNNMLKKGIDNVFELVNITNYFKLPETVEKYKKLTFNERFKSNLAGWYETAPESVVLFTKGISYFLFIRPGAFGVDMLTFWRRLFVDKEKDPIKKLEEMIDTRWKAIERRWNEKAFWTDVFGESANLVLDTLFDGIRAITSNTVGGVLVGVKRAFLSVARKVWGK